MAGIEPNRALLALVLAVSVVTGCSGNTTATEQPGVPFGGVLLAEEFDGEKLAERWSPSDPGATEVANGVLTIRDDGKRNMVTLRNPDFGNEDLEIIVRVAPPDDATTCQRGLPLLTPIILVLDAVTGEPVAGVMFLRWPCGNASLTKFRYWIGDPNLRFFEELLPSGAVTGDFFEFTLRMDERREATWQRDGADKFVALFDVRRALGLRLSSGQGDPVLPMQFDSVVVRRTRDRSGTAPR